MRFSLAQLATTLLRATSKLLPKHIRRLVLWCTLYGNICNARKLTKEQSTKLNNALNLCKDEAALDLPTMLGKFIWKDLDGCSIAARKAIRGEESPDVAAEAFVNSIPSFLRYASDAFMLKDFQSLMSTHHAARVG